eukprot:743361-Rhodomonas_salina.2
MSEKRVAALMRFINLHSSLHVFGSRYLVAVLAPSLSTARRNHRQAITAPVRLVPGALKRVRVDHECKQPERGGVCAAHLCSSGCKLRIMIIQTASCVSRASGDYRSRSPRLWRSQH